MSEGAERTDEQVYQMTDDELLVHVADGYYQARMQLQAANASDAQIALAGRIGNLLQNGLAGIVKSRAIDFDHAFKDEDYRRVAQIAREVAGAEHASAATKLLMALTNRTPKAGA